MIKKMSKPKKNSKIELKILKLKNYKHKKYYFASKRKYIIYFKIYFFKKVFLKEKICVSGRINKS